MKIPEKLLWHLNATFWALKSEQNVANLSIFVAHFGILVTHFGIFKAKFEL